MKTAPREQVLSMQHQPITKQLDRSWYLKTGCFNRRPIKDSQGRRTNFVWIQTDWFSTGLNN